MQFASPLIPGILLKRYKRFLADVRLEDGREVVAHCPNTGAMTGCAEPGFQVWLRPANDPKRKLQYTWELVVNAEQHIIGVNTANANTLVAEALDLGVITECRHYTQIRREVAYGSEKSKVDFLLSGEGVRPLYLEVKSVTLLAGTDGKKSYIQQPGLGCFPDARTERGQKHIRELIAVQESGAADAAILFCVQHTGITSVTAAELVDPEYAALMEQAQSKGVIILAYGCDIGPQGISLTTRLPYLLN